MCQLGYSRPGKPGIDWDDPDAKRALVSDLVNDALGLLAQLTGEDAPQRDEQAADALGLLALVAGQDVEPAEDSGGTDGRWRIAGKVASDRVISTVGTQARHTRKSKSVRRGGFRAHVAAEPETGLVTGCEMTMAAGEGSSDAGNGVKMVTQDRFRGRDGEAAGDGQNGESLEIYGDSHYGTGQARADYQPAGHDTVIKPIPVRPAVPGGFTRDDFVISEHDGTVTCPAGHTRLIQRQTVCHLRRCMRGLPAAGTMHHRQRRPVPGYSPARGPAARRPRPGPHIAVPAGLPDPRGDRADHRLDRHQQRAPDPAALPRQRQK